MNVFVLAAQIQGTSRKKEISPKWSIEDSSWINVKDELSINITLPLLMKYMFDPIEFYIKI